MAKSKNHTAHNQTRKAHRNGIHKPKWQKYTKTKGMDPKYLRNLKWSKKHNLSPSEMSKYNRKKFVSKKLVDYVKKRNLRLKKKAETPAKGEKTEQTATTAASPKKITVATLSKAERNRVILTAKQRTAKKWRFISRGDRRKEQIYGGSSLLRIKTILHKRYNAELHERRLRMKKIKKTLPGNNYVKFFPRVLLGPEKRIKKTHKQVLAIQEDKKKAKRKARAKGGKKPAADKSKDDKGKGKKGAEKSKGGKEKPKAGEKPKGEKPKAEKPKAEKVEKPKAEKAEKPKAEKAEKPKAEKAEKPKVEKPKGEEKPKAEKPKGQKKAEKPKAEETPAT